MRLTPGFARIFHVYTPSSSKSILHREERETAVDEQLKQIDWKTIGKFLQKLTPGKRCNAIQLLHGWQNTNKQNAIIERLKMMTKQ